MTEELCVRAEVRWGGLSFGNREERGILPRSFLFRRRLKNGTRACLKIVNMPKQRGLSRHTALI